MEIDNVGLKTERGKDLREHDGRMYRQENPKKGDRRSANGTKSTSYWKCCRKGCNGRLSLVQPLNVMTGLPAGDSCFEDRQSSHSEFCAPNIADIKRKKGEKLVEAMVVSGSHSLPRAVGEVVGLLRNSIGDLEASQFRTPLQLQRTVNNAVSHKDGHPPTTYAALDSIPREFGITRAGQQFLLVFEKYYDINGTDSGVIIVFATTADLVKLFQASVILVDGTFKTKPYPYARERSAQVFTMNTLEGVFPSKRMFRRVLALLSRKTEHCYWTCIRLILHAAITTRGISISPPNLIRWKELMCDFEKGIHNAFSSVVVNLLQLPMIQLACCHMHYCSAIIKQVKKLGMASHYTNPLTGLQTIIGLLFAVVFLPYDRIVPVYRYIKDNHIAPSMLAYPPMRSFLEDYFEVTWISNDHILAAISVFNRDDHSKRTQNDLEGKHRLV